MSRNLINYRSTPQVTGLEYEEVHDLEKHPEKKGYYDALIKNRTQMGNDFETKSPRKKKKRRSA